MDIGLNMESAFQRAFVEKFDPIFFHVEAAAHFAEFIEEGDHVQMLRAFDKDLPFRADARPCQREAASMRSVMTVCSTS